MEELFNAYCSDLDEPLLKAYKGHVYRVFNYAMYLLDYDETHMREIEAALVFHDLAACKMESMRYLEPSYEFLIAENDRHNWGLNAGLMIAIIEFHHKIFKFNGDHATIVNAVRSGDWIEVSFNYLTMGVPKEVIKKVAAKFPTGNFVSLIGVIGPKVSGSRIKLIQDMLHVIKI